jgi:8-oxo-dGTP pyrophosphatase MutT (NUDIX family)
VVEKRAKRRGKLKREFSAGGVVFKKEKGKTKWLIIQPKGTDRWQLPKGQIDEGESSRKAAVREVEEEGGVKTRLIKKLGDTRYFYILHGEKIFKTVTFYLMEYQGSSKKGPDKKEIDKVTFVPFEEAIKKLTFKDDRKMVEKGKAFFDHGVQQNLI